jgi:hypothetical protein
MQVPVMGSAWIDWGPGGSGWMNFMNYSLYYQMQGNSSWTKIVKDSLVEIRHNALAHWNTNGRSPGNYLLKLTVKNNFNDSVEALKPITLKAGTTGIEQFTKNNVQVKVFPNPGNGMLFIQMKDAANQPNENTSVEIYNTTGQKVSTQQLQNNETQFNLSGFSKGVYQIRLIQGNTLIYQGRVVKE